MGRIWNLIGWMTVTLIVPALIFVSMSESECDHRFLSHSTTCKPCRAAQVGRHLPDVIDGDNLHVIIPKESTATTAGPPVAHHL